MIFFKMKKSNFSVASEPLPNCKRKEELRIWVIAFKKILYCRMTVVYEGFFGILLVVRYGTYGQMVLSQN